MVKFTPHEDYKMLLRQANSLHMLYMSQCDEIARLRAIDYDTRIERIAALEESLESERDMNHILTQELEELRDKT